MTRALDLAALIVGGLLAMCVFYAAEGLAMLGVMQS